MAYDQSSYSKGYAAGCRRGDREVAKARQSEQEALARAMRAEDAQGLGRCRDCAHWRREKESMWGYCKPPGAKYSEVEGAIWFGAPSMAGGLPYEVTTSAAFGCVLFLKRAVLAADTSS